MRMEIQAVGNPNFPRFIIANSKGQVFDGNGWNKDRKKAILYVAGQEVAVQFRALEEAIHEHLPLREFSVTLNIRVRAAGNYTVKELEEYLERAVCILLDHEKGSGPVPNSVVQLDVTWADMKQKNGESVRDDQRKA